MTSQSNHSIEMSPIMGLLDHVIQNIECKNRLGSGQWEVLRRNAGGHIPIDVYEMPELTTPNIDMKEPAIRLPLGYLEHLWALCYGVFVTIETLQGRLIEVPGNFSVEPTDELTQRAWRLLDWSMNRVHAPVQWPDDAPRPDRIFESEESEWITKSSTLFVDAVSFVAMHELAHMLQEHGSYAGAVDSISFAEHQAVEREADAMAIESIRTSGPLVEAGFIDGMGMLLALSSLLLIPPGRPLPVSTTHPDPDARLLNALASLSRDRPEHTDYANLLCGFALSLRLQRSDREIPQGPFDDTESLLDGMAEAIAMHKQADQESRLT